MHGHRIRKMNRLHWISTAAMLAGIVVLTTPSPTFADLLVTLQDGSGTTASVISVTGSPAPFPGLSGSFSGNIGGTGVVSTGGDFTVVNQTGQSTQSFVGGSAEVFSSTTSITNISNSTQTLHIIVAGNDYSSPIMGVLASHIGGTSPVTVNSTNVLTFQSYANPANTLAVGGTSPGAQVVSLSNPTSFASDASVGVSGLSATGFSLVQSIDITLASGAQINFSSSSILTPTPEPATVAMALTALPLLGLGTWIRRRRARA